MSSEKVVNSTFVDRLLRLISEKAKGQPSTFARLAGIPHGTFYGYINGRLPAAEHLVRIRDTFGANINWLLTGDGEPYSAEEPGKLAEPGHLYGAPEERVEGEDLSNAAKAELADLLNLARKVLTSGNRQAAEALELNIRYLARAIEMEERLAKLEGRFHELMDLLKNKGIVRGTPEDEAI